MNMTDPNPAPVPAPDDATLRRIFDEARVFACVGASANPARPSHYVSQFLVDRGYRVIPVNPGLAGQTLFGETVRADLAAIDEAVDVIDVFRQSEALPGLVEEALAMVPRPAVLWTQLGVIHPGAARRAHDAGMTVVENRCPKIEYPRLYANR